MMRRITTTGALLLLCAAAAAQDMDETEPGEDRRYTVEVIIFEYAEDVSVGTERFLPEISPLQMPDETAEGERVFGDARVRTAAAQDDEAARDYDTDALVADPEFMRHTEDAFTMNDIASRLERLDVYKPIMHFAWTQVTRPEEETRPIELRALADPVDGLDGSLTLYLSRYLHLVVDLTLEQPADLADPLVSDDSANAFRDDSAAASFEPVSQGPVRFRIFENRIFKSGDLRYFDHPKFGVLAKITREEEPDDGEDEAGLVGELGQ